MVQGCPNTHKIEPKHTIGPRSSIGPITQDVTVVLPKNIGIPVFKLIHSLGLKPMSEPPRPLQELSWSDSLSIRSSPEHSDIRGIVYYSKTYRVTNPGSGMKNKLPCNVCQGLELETTGEGPIVKGRTLYRERIHIPTLDGEADAKGEDSEPEMSGMARLKPMGHWNDVALPLPQGDLIQ
ncbi:hypothetical protein BS47DRAFT_1357489 [Hydnum rufescens UP504]|uniref:Uncharacterized protein n=1 Tax=Hydnum rufescens UP504 TaxID=1448309 RepID=A0A9P6B9K2_9AGAM|nr:hypothetical protein BS47DRAFT_1357489 [Hydnum rufescens UP504]